MRTNNKLWYCLLALFSAMLITTTARAQVRVGGEADPQPGAVLDLEMKQGGNRADYYTGGLHLPNIDITDLGKIPGSLGTSTTPYTFLAGMADRDTDMALKGMVVYNINETTGKGIYFWDGEKWNKVDCGCCSNVDISNPGEPNTPYNPEYPGNKFPNPGGEKGPYTPTGGGDCSLDPAYTAVMISGNAYARISYAGISTADKKAGKFNVAFDPNPNNYTRYAIVRVTNNCSKQFKDFLFEQEPAALWITPDPSNPDGPAGGGQHGPYTPVTTCTNPGTYSAHCHEDWLKVSINPTTGRFYIQFEPNNTTERRSATITISMTGCDNLSTEFTVWQQGKNPGIDPETQPNIPPLGPEYTDDNDPDDRSTKPVTPKSDPACTQAPPYSLSLVAGMEYAHINIIEEQNGKFSVTFDENYTKFERYATVRVRDNCSSLYSDFTFIQNPGDDFTITPLHDFEPDETPREIKVRDEDRKPGNYTFELLDPETTPYAEIASTDPANGKFVLDFETNYTKERRCVRVKATDPDGVYKVFTICQKAWVSDINIDKDPAVDIFDGDGSTLPIEVIDPGKIPTDETHKYKFEVLDPDNHTYGHITDIDPDNATFNLTFDPNDSEDPRTVTVRVTDPLGETKDYTFTQVGKTIVEDTGKLGTINWNPSSNAVLLTDYNTNAVTEDQKASRGVGAPVPAAKQNIAITYSNATPGTIAEKVFDVFAMDDEGNTTPGQKNGTLKITFPETEITAANGTVNLKLEGKPDKSGAFDYAMNIGGATVTVRVLVGCGYYVAKPVSTIAGKEYYNVTDWLGVMCHFKGADYEADPFTPSLRLKSPDYYQWGRPEPLHVGDLTDRNPTGHKNPIGEGNNPLYYNLNPEDGIKNAIPTENDPCPGSWRLPTGKELQNMIYCNNVRLLNNAAQEYWWCIDRDAELVTPLGYDTPTMNMSWSPFIFYTTNTYIYKDTYVLGRNELKDGHLITSIGTYDATKKRMIVNQICGQRYLTAIMDVARDKKIVVTGNAVWTGANYVETNTTTSTYSYDTSHATCNIRCVKR